VVKILVAGIAIQASRFVVAAIIDVSTIATAAVGAFPSQLMTTSPQFRDGFRSTPLLKQLTDSYGISQKIKMELFPESQTGKMLSFSTEAVNGELTEETIADLFLPNANSLVGSLVYLGASILETNSISDSTVNVNEPRNAIIKIIIEGFGIIMYSIAMIFLSIIAGMRILYLWLFIAISPIVILIFCLDNVGKDKIKGLDSLTKEMSEKGISVKGFIGLAFKPVLVTL
jgi:hypothetical protein